MSWLRSPLLHFLLLGLLIFAAEGIRQSSARAEAGGPRRIEIEASRVAALEQEFATQMGRAPDPQEIDGLLATEIDEEILYREALARGLLERDGGVKTRLIQKMLFLDGHAEIDDARALLARAIDLELYRDDIVVRRILIQKMRLFGSMLDAAERPSEAEIAARYAAVRAGLREPDRVSFRHVFLSADDRREATLEDALALRERIAAESLDLDAVVALGDPFPLGYRFLRRSARDLDRTFGADFGAQALANRPGEWSAPIESAYGHHLVFIEARDAGRTPPLDVVADRIRRELEREREAIKLEALLSDLHQRYEVVVHRSSKEMG